MSVTCAKEVLVDTSLQPERLLQDRLSVEPSTKTVMSQNCSADVGGDFLPVVTCVNSSLVGTYSFLMKPTDDKNIINPWYLHPHWRVMPQLDPALRVVIGTIMLVVGIGGALGNSTILYFLFRYKKLRKSANVYVVNLASVDVLMCVANFPFFVYSCFEGKWVTGYTTCQVYSFLGGVTGFVSINTLTAMACDRYSAIFRRHGVPRSDSASCSRSLGLLISVWIYSIFWSAPPFFGWGHFSLDGGRVSCCFDYLTRSASNVSYIVAIFIFCFAIQMAVIIFCYVSMMAAFVKRKGDLMGGEVPAESHRSRSGDHTERFASVTLRSSASSAIFSITPSKVKRRRRELRVTRLVCCITMSFCCAWLPFAVVALIGTFGDASHITPMVSTLPGMLAKTSTVVNPLIYAIGHPQYRKVLQKNWRRARGHGTERGCRKDCCGSNSKIHKRLASGNLQGTLPSSYFATVMVKTDADGNADILAGGR